MFQYATFYWEYYLFMIPALILVFGAQFYVNSRYKKYSNINTNMRISGKEAAQHLLNQNEVNSVGIGMVKGQMTDHYHPKKNTIFLSEGVCDSTSVAAVGIAAHEAGHAVQHAKGYFPIKIRTALVPFCNIGSTLALPLCLFGSIFSLPPLVFLGIIFFSFAVLFQLVTLPVEFNASRRAMEFVKNSGMFTESEYKGVKSVLTAAALTYVAALAQSLIQILYYIMRFSRSRK